MNKYKILIGALGNYYKICEWDSDTKKQAIKEFLDMNPAYENRIITAEQIL